MSRNEWEYGSIKVPSKEWAKFRSGLLREWNESQDRLYTDAQAAHKACKASAKGLRGDARKQALEAALEAHCTGYQRDLRGVAHKEIDYSRLHQIERLIFKRETWNGPIKLQAPKRKDLDKVPVSKGCRLSLGEASVTFNNKTREVIWDVPENNHACTNAREHFFAKALFKALGRITWTAKSGGQIVGNDEYNRDSDYEGGGSNYVVATYSKAQQEANRAARAARGRYNYGSYGMNYGRRW